MTTRGKKITAIFILGLLLFGTAFADEAVPEQEEIKVMLEGQEIIFADQQPIIKEGRTLVPARSVFEELGAIVSWAGETQTVTVEKDEITIQLTIGSDVLLKNGEEIQTYAPPAEIINDRTMLPLRAVVEAMDCFVTWAQEQKTVHIYKKSAFEERNEILGSWFNQDEAGPYVSYKLFETAYGTVIYGRLTYAPHHVSCTLFCIDRKGTITTLDTLVPEENWYINLRYDDVALSEDGKTITYFFSTDNRKRVLVTDDEVNPEEEGIYYFSANLETGENKLTEFIPKER